MNILSITYIKYQNCDKYYGDLFYSEIVLLKNYYISSIVCKSFLFIGSCFRFLLFQISFTVFDGKIGFMNVANSKSILIHF